MFVLIEFVTVCMDQKQLLTKNRLKRAFEMFDTDQSGKISNSELQSVRKLIGSSTTFKATEIIFVFNYLFICNSFQFTIVGF